QCSVHDRVPHSFPTRRSSDLFEQPLIGALRADIELSEVRETDWIHQRNQNRHLTLLTGPPADVEELFSAQIRIVHADQQPRTKRSEEHTSELQSRENLVCRLL